MRNCRASIVAETEKPFLMEHQRLYPPPVAFQIQEKLRWIVLIVVRFKKRPLVETEATRLSIASCRHAHIHYVSYYCCCAARLYT